MNEQIKASAEESTPLTLEETLMDSEQEEEVIEVKPGAKYKLNKRVIEGELLSDWDRHFTQSQQDLKTEVKRTQQENEQLKQEVEALKQYIDAAQTQQPQQSDYSYDYANPSVDPNKLVSEITDKVSKAVQSQIQKQLQEREERTKKEISLQKQEDAWKQKHPGLDMDEIYGALASVEEGDLDGMMERLTKFANLVSKQKQATIELKRKAALEAYSVAPPSPSKPSPLSFPAAKGGVRDRIAKAKENAKKDMELQERGAP